MSYNNLIKQKTDKEEQLERCKKCIYKVKVTDSKIYCPLPKCIEKK